MVLYLFQYLQNLVKGIDMGGCLPCIYIHHGAVEGPSDGSSGGLNENFCDKFKHSSPVSIRRSKITKAELLILPSIHNCKKSVVSVLPVSLYIIHQSCY